MTRKGGFESGKTAEDIWTISSQAPKSKDMEKVQRLEPMLVGFKRTRSTRQPTGLII